METEIVLISALQHYEFCPRQFALIHIEQVWAENRYTAEGQLLHERVDSGIAEQRRNLRFERSVQLVSRQYGLIGKMDLLEIESGNPPRYFPVEYKRGKPKVEDWDRVQVCAQALCIEEMRQVTVDEAAIWYWEVRQRERVVLNTALREATLSAINGARELLINGRTPPPTSKKSRCRACSLVDICEPKTFRNDRSRAYVSDIFEEQICTDIK